MWITFFTDPQDNFCIILCGVCFVLYENDVIKTQEADVSGAEVGNVTVS
jgi:hypothetical protein